MHSFNLNSVDPSWLTCLEKGIASLEPNYLKSLNEKSWLPGPHHIFNAFSLPLEKVNYVLFGESPYPRAESAIGYAFWDGAVQELWSETGLSTRVNRATSLRNIIKMLLVAEGKLPPNATSQADIAALDKTGLITNNAELFSNFHRHGFLLLNACLVLQTSSRNQDARAWSPFLGTVLDYLLEKRPHVTFIFLGRIAHKIEKIIEGKAVKKISVEHPYNYTFVTNTVVLDFFRPFHLLNRAL